MKYTLTSFASRATKHLCAAQPLVGEPRVSPLGLRGAAGCRCRGRDNCVGARGRTGDVFQLHTSGRRLLASSPSCPTNLASSANVIPPPRTSHATASACASPAGTRTGPGGTPSTSGASSSTWRSRTCRCPHGTSGTFSRAADPRVGHRPREPRTVSPSAVCSPCTSPRACGGRGRNVPRCWRVMRALLNALTKGDAAATVAKKLRTLADRNRAAQDVLSARSGRVCGSTSQTLSVSPNQFSSLTTPPPSITA